MTRNLPCWALGLVLAAAGLTPVQAQAPQPVPAPATAEVPGALTIYAASSVNIRAGAGKHYQIIGKVHAGQAVLATPATPGWYQLTTGGFVSARLFSVAPVVAAPPVVATTVAPAPVYVAPQPVYVAPYYYVPRHPYYRRYPYPY